MSLIALCATLFVVVVSLVLQQAVRYVAARQIGRKLIAVQFGFPTIWKIQWRGITVRLGLPLFGWIELSDPDKKPWQAIPLYLITPVMHWVVWQTSLHFAPSLPIGMTMEDLYSIPMYSAMVIQAQEAIGRGDLGGILFLFSTYHFVNMVVTGLPFIRGIDGNQALMVLLENLFGSRSWFVAFVDRVTTKIGIASMVSMLYWLYWEFEFWFPWLPDISPHHLYLALVLFKDNIV